MCQKCDELNASVRNLTEDQLWEHHFDLLHEVSFLVRENIETQQRIAMLSGRLNEVEVEFEVREQAVKAERPKKSKEPKKSKKSKALLN